MTQNKTLEIFAFFLLSFLSVFFFNENKKEIKRSQWISGRIKIDLDDGDQQRLYNELAI